MTEQAREGAELILLGGRIRTMEPERPLAEAVAVAAGRFVAVGSNEEVLRLRADRTVVEDLRGACVLPGLIDSHIHLESVGTALRDADLYDARSIGEILEKLSAHAKRLEAPAPVLGRGDCFHPTCLSEGRLPNREDLDRVATGRVVAVTDVNKTILNTYALERLGIGPDAEPPAGGVIGRDSGGGLDGTFYYAAKGMTQFGSQSASSAELPFGEAVLEGARAVAAAGLTSVVLPGARPDGVAAVQELDRAGALPVRVTVMPFISVLDDKDSLARLDCGAGTDMVTIGPLKVVYDHFIMHKTALMHEPFVNEPSNRGGSLCSKEELDDLVRRAVGAGWPVGIHVTGDRGLDDVIDAIARAPKETLARPHHVIHAYFPTDEAPRRLAELGVPAAVQPPFLRAWGETVRKFVGRRRAEGFYPYRRLLDVGVVLGGGSDGPIACPRPGLGLHAAVTRLTAGGSVLGAGQGITVEEALRMYTIGSAAVLGESDRKGSIREGKLADMIVLEKDPCRVVRTTRGPDRPGEAPRDDILGLNVLRTIVGGKTVFSGETE